MVTHEYALLYPYDGEVMDVTTDIDEVREALEWSKSMAEDLADSNVFDDARAAEKFYGAYIIVRPYGDEGAAWAKLEDD